MVICIFSIKQLIKNSIIINYLNIIEKIKSNVYIMNENNKVRLKELEVDIYKLINRKYKEFKDIKIQFETLEDEDINTFNYKTIYDYLNHI